jgi:hypothetical protein
MSGTRIGESNSHAEAETDVAESREFQESSSDTQSKEVSHV